MQVWDKKNQQQHQQRKCFNRIRIDGCVCVFFYFHHKAVQIFLMDIMNLECGLRAVNAFDWSWYFFFWFSLHIVALFWGKFQTNKGKKKFTNNRQALESPGTHKKKRTKKEKKKNEPFGIVCLKES